MASPKRWIAVIVLLLVLIACLFIVFTPSIFHKTEVGFHGGRRLNRAEIEAWEAIIESERNHPVVRGECVYTRRSLETTGNQNALRVNVTPMSGKGEIAATSVVMALSLTLPDYKGYGTALPDGFPANLLQFRSFLTITNDFKQLWSLSGEVTGAVAVYGTKGDKGLLFAAVLDNEGVWAGTVEPEQESSVDSTFVLTIIAKIQDARSRAK